MTSPGREGGRGPAPGNCGLAGGPAWGRARSGGRGPGGEDAWTPRSAAPKATPSPQPRVSVPEPDPRSPRTAGSTRLRGRRAPQRSGGAASILLRPCILITAALIFMRRDSRGPRAVISLARAPPQHPSSAAESWIFFFPSRSQPRPRQQLVHSGSGVHECEHECERCGCCGQERRPYWGDRDTWWGAECECGMCLWVCVETCMNVSVCLCVSAV